MPLAPAPPLVLVAPTPVRQIVSSSYAGKRCAQSFFVWGDRLQNQRGDGGADIVVIQKLVDKSGALVGWRFKLDDRSFQYASTGDPATALFAPPPYARVTSCTDRDITAP